MSIDKKAKSTIKNEWKSKTQKAIRMSNKFDDEKSTNSSNTNVSVFTRTTNPKVIIESENVNWSFEWKEHHGKHKLLKFICMMIMCLIILMTFFLSLKTYNMVHNLSEYFVS